MRHEAETGGAIAERRAEDGNVLLVGFEDDAVGRLALLFEIGAHFADDLARAVRLGFQVIDDLLHRVIAYPKLILVDQGVVNPVDHHFVQHAIVHTGLEVFIRDVVAEAETLEEILIDDVGAGGDDRINHPVPHHVGEDFLQPGAVERSGQTENDAAILVAEHPVVNLRGPVEIACAVSHVLHRIDHGDRIVLGDIDMLDCPAE